MVCRLPPYRGESPFRDFPDLCRSFQKPDFGEDIFLTFEEKRDALRNKLEQLASDHIALAFSGGVDSSLLYRMCCEAAEKTGRKVHAITIHTQLHPMNDLVTAGRVAAEGGVRGINDPAGGSGARGTSVAEHHVLYLDELEEAGIRFNPVDRCYLCKKCLFQKLIAKAEELDAHTVLDGTNADDLTVYRPGIRALRELGVISPLAELGITKQEVRQMAAEYGLSVSTRPSTPCLATRFPYGRELDYGLIRRVEEAEEWLRAQGFYNVRLRVHGAIARIEVDPESMSELVAMREDVLLEMAKCGFDYITVDLAGFRSGSMDIHIDKA